MRRWLFNFAAGLSLLICAAAAIEWARSYEHVDILGFRHESWPQSNDFHVRLLSSRFSQGYWLLVDGDSDFSVDDLKAILGATDTDAAEFRKAHPGGMSFTHVFIDLRTVPAGAFNVMFGDPNRYHFGPLQSRANNISRVGVDTNKKIVIMFAWVPVVIASVLPVFWVIVFFWRIKRVNVGCCAVCGYDLRATPERCPECGQVVAKLGPA